MDLKTKILSWVVAMSLILSITSTFYKTIILQDFEVTGTWIEIGDDWSYVWFMYENKEYELELATTVFEEILTETANEIGIPEKNIDPIFIESLDWALEDALILLEEGV